MNASEEALYAEALNELQSNAASPGIWAKAFSESEGDKIKAQALYIKLRVQQKLAESKPELKNTISEKIAGVVKSLNENGYVTAKENGNWVVKEPLNGTLKPMNDDELLKYSIERLSKQEPHTSELLNAKKLLNEHGYEVNNNYSTWQVREPNGGKVTFGSEKQFLDYALSRGLQIKTIETKEQNTEDQLRPDKLPLLLWILIVGLVAIGPIKTLLETSNIYTQEMLNPELKSLEIWNSAKILIWSVTLPKVILSIYTGLYLRKNYYWDAIKKSIALIWFIGPASLIIFSLSSYIFLPQIANLLLDDIFISFISSVVFSIVWTIYLLSSKTVKIIYRKPN